MLTFLRKIRKSLIESGRARKYVLYALGEIVLVMIGILLALQVNNWNEQRKLKTKERIYLTELKGDLLESKTELERVISKTKIVFESCDTLTKMLKFAPSSLTLQQIDTLSGIATGYTIFMPNEGVVNDIIGSGQLDLIRNKYLRTRIASWHADLSMIKEWEKIGRETSYKYNDQLDQYVDLVNMLYQRMVLDPSLKENLVMDRSLRNTLFIIAANMKNLNTLYNERSMDLDSMIQVIDQELR